MHHGIRRIICTFALAMAALQGTASAQSPVPAESFARWPLINEVLPSPNGKRMALLITGDDGSVRLAVMNLAPVDKPKIVGAVRDGDVRSVIWVNDNRLVYEAFRKSAEIGEGGAGTFAVNHDGSDSAQLISWKTDFTTGTTITSKVLPYGWFLSSAVGGDSADVLVYQRQLDSDGDLLRVSYARLDTQTRQLRNLSLGLPAYTQQVLFDAKLEPRLAITRRKGRLTYQWRAKAGGEWQQIADFSALQPDYDPLHIGPDGEVLVSASPQGVDALHRLDPKTLKLDPEPIIKINGFDLYPRLEVDSRTHRVAGLHFTVDRPMSYWFDERLQQEQGALDKALPGRFNRIYCGECETSQFLVVQSVSDRQPAEYYLYDRKNPALTLIGAARPWIEEAQQGRRSFHRYEARDGLKVPLVVTHPAGAKPDERLPAVLLVHGGPFSRGGDLRWDAEAQFLASRGYRVLAPEFRGSMGFGSAHFEAGWKQWGRKMQDDMVDAVQWAAKQGLVDAKRVCIMGGSYGGYSALMGPIAHPGAYRCAVSFAGVSDLSLLSSFGWSDLSEASLRYDMSVLMGDPSNGKLDPESPLKRVAEFKVPLLIAHGGLDRRVQIVHTRRFVSAAEAAGVKVETAYYMDEPHGFLQWTNRLDYFKRVETFLEGHLKGPAP